MSKSLYDFKGQVTLFVRENAPDQINTAFIFAVRWFQNGDCTLPLLIPKLVNEDNGKLFLGEGRDVRRYRHPGVDGKSRCSRCGSKMDDHGWLEVTDAKVCPGDWVLRVELTPGEYKWVVTDWAGAQKIAEEVNTPLCTES